MVVEDEAVIRENIVKKANTANRNFKVQAVCKNGQDALKTLSVIPVDVVITDIKMPIMDGMELAKKIHENHASVKIIILSGYSDFNYAKKAIAYNVSDYLLKPLDIEELRKTLNRILFEIKNAISELESKEMIYQNLTVEQLSELVQKYLLNNFRKNITLSQISKHFGYTSEYIGRVFKKYNQKTILKHLTTLRINEAKKLLMSDENFDIGSVGQKVGYTDPSYFSRVFKNNVGTYPKEFIKLYKNKSNNDI